MKQLSLVDGFVKLYDTMATSTFRPPTTNILLRVRGILWHGIGQLRLVSSHTPVTQTALYIPPTTVAKNQQHHRVLLVQTTTTTTNETTADSPRLQQRQQQPDETKAPTTESNTDEVNVEQARRR
jgi:hypothetical protein